MAYVGPKHQKLGYPFACLGATHLIFSLKHKCNKTTVLEIEKE